MLKSLYSRQNTVLSDLLRTSRISRRLRQRDLASRIGHGQALVSKVERGERRLDVLELRAWIEALDLDFAAFVLELDQRLRTHGVSDLMLTRPQHPAVRLAPNDRGKSKAASS